MNNDIRVSVSFRGHRKRKRLRRLLGPRSTDCLIDLWISTAMNHPSGLLIGMDETDIALEAGWEGKPDSFVEALVECRLLDKTDAGYALHDWAEHQGYAVHAEERRERAKNAAAKRWERRQGTALPEGCPEHTNSIAYPVRDVCNAHTLGNAVPESGSAPSPVPAPSPIPAPVPIPFPSPVQAGERENNPEGYQLAALMRDTLKANLPTFREPNLQTWAQAFDVALHTDERMKEPSFVAAVIKWACSDSFWRANIQSPQKLRDKFDQLTAKMENAAEMARAASKREKWQSSAQRRVEANQEAGREAKRILFGDDPEVAHDPS